MQAWNWGATATQGGTNFVPPQTYPGGVATMYQGTAAAQPIGAAGQIQQTFPAASALVPGQQIMANYQQFYGAGIPASTEIPAGYTAQQWEAAQQQHFIQWQQWNQQYQQWQQEYGSTYSMAMQGGQPKAPTTSAAEPPPLPPPEKPPPPPEESRVDSKFQVPPIESFKGQKRPIEGDHTKFQEPADKKHHSDDGQHCGRDGMWGSTVAQTYTPDNEEADRSDQEKLFDAQFLNWEQEFSSWKQQNINHPDKTQYIEYEKKWTKWRLELLHRREQMRKKRLSSMAKASADSAASKSRQKDQSGFPDSKTCKNLDSEFHVNKQQGDSGPESMPSGSHSKGFGFRSGARGQQQQGAPGGFSSKSEQDAKTVAALPLQFTDPFSKKGYGGANMEKEDSTKLQEGGRFGDNQNPQGSHLSEQKDMSNTWNQNFQSTTKFNMNPSGNNQQFEANSSSNRPYCNQANSMSGQNMPPDSDLSKMSTNPAQAQKKATSLENKVADVVDITNDEEDASKFEFLKKSNVIPGLDLCPEKSNDTRRKETPNNDGREVKHSSQSQLGPDTLNDSHGNAQGPGQFGPDKNVNQGLLPQPGTGMMVPPLGQGMLPTPGHGMLPTPGQGMLPTPGQGMVSPRGQYMVPPPVQGMMGPPPGPGLLPPPGFMSNLNMNQWPGHNAQQEYSMNRGQGFPGNMPGFGPFGQGGQMASLPSEGPGNPNPNFSSGNQGSGNQGPYMGGQNNNGPGNQNSKSSPGNKVQTMTPGNQNQNVGVGGNQNQHLSPGNQNKIIGPNFGSPGKGPNMGPGHQGNMFAQDNRGANYNHGPALSPGSNSNFGPGNVNSNLHSNMKGPNMMSHNFGSGGQGGMMNMGPNNQGSFGPNTGSNFGPNSGSNFGPNSGSNFGPNSGSNFGPNAGSNFGPNAGSNFGPNAGSNFGANAGSNFAANAGSNFGANAGSNFGANAGSNFGPNAGSNFGPGNQNVNSATGNQGPHFGQGDQFNRSNQGFGNHKMGAMNVDVPRTMRDQMLPGGHGSGGGDKEGWSDMQDGRNQGSNNWNDSVGTWNQNSGGRDPQNMGPRRDKNQGPMSNFPHGKHPGDTINQFTPKDGFPEGNQGSLLGPAPPGNEPFNKGMQQGMKDNFPRQDKFGDMRESLSKDEHSFPPERENLPRNDGDFPDVRDEVPTALSKADRAPGYVPNFRGPQDDFTEGPDFRGPRNRFMDDRDPFQGPVDSLGGPGPGDPFPPDTRGDFDRERFLRRDHPNPIDGPRGGFPDRDFNRGPFRDDLRGRDEAFHGDRRGMDFDDRRYPRDHLIDDRGYEFGRGGGGWDPRGGDRPPHDYYRPRQFGVPEDDPYVWDRTQHASGWESAMELEPVTIVEYGHKPAPSTPLITESSTASLLENVQTFDYAHGKMPKNARDPTTVSEPWRRDDHYSREHERDKRSYERDARWEKDRDRDRSRREDEERSSKYPDDDRYRSRSDDRSRRSDRDNDRDRGRSRDSKRDGDSGRNSKSGPPPCAPPPPTFSSPSESGKGGTPVSDTAVGVSVPPPAAPSRPILVEDLLSPPGRDSRPQRIVIILRGPPGSGKTFVAKLIKDKEVEMGGPPPRILCLDDYFMVELEKEEKDPETGRKVKVKMMEYEFEPGMEKDYRCSLVKSFKKTVNENYFPFIIVDCVNQKVKDFEEMWSYAKQKGFQVYICEMDMDISSCSKRNTHNRTEKEIQVIVKGWEETPKYYLRLDVRSLLQSVAITEVEMEDSAPNDDEEKKVEKEEEKTNEDEGNEADEDINVSVSKWERMEPSGDKLDRLDGLRRRKQEDKPRTLEDWLQLSTDYESRESKPGQKRVRWADLEEKREQEKMRAIGFVVGQTDWSRMTDPTFGESALTQTKYI